MLMYKHKNEIKWKILKYIYKPLEGEQESGSYRSTRYR